MAIFWNIELIQTESLLEALSLDISGKRLIGVVGGGGKTAAIYRLAGELRSMGKRVMITTTAHMQKPKGIPLVLNCGESELQEVLERDGIVMTGWQDPENEGKICGVTAESLQRFRELADVVLVEADGARHMPLKAPAPWEPVLVEECDIVIAVAGVDAIGKTFQECSFRPRLTSGLLGRNLTDVVDGVDVADILCHAEGGRKNVRGEFRVLINKIDLRQDRKLGEHLAAEFAGRGVQAAFSSCRDHIALILLAAGSSTRFDGNKLLYELDGKPMYRYAVELAERLPVDSRILVTQYSEIQMELENSSVQTLINPFPEKGISGSIELGVRAAGNADAYLFLVCDQPWLRLETLEALMERYQTGGRGIGAVVCAGNPGSPNIFSASYREELMALTGDTGGRQIIRRHPEDVITWEVAGAAELTDIDTRAGLVKV